MHNEQNFLKSIDAKCQPGQRNNNIPFFVNKAKYYELDYLTALNCIKSIWSDMTTVDCKSFEKAWKDIKTTPEKTVSEYKKSAKERAKEIHNQDKNINNDQVALNLEVLKNHLKNVEIPEADLELTETTKDLEYWFDKNDIIWISSRYDDIRGCKDLYTLLEHPRSLNEYSYMCVNPFNYDAMERKDENVSEFKYLLIESDNLDLETQARLFQDMINFNVPIKSVIYSGGKSFHALIQLKDIYTVEDYKEYAKKIFDLINSFIGISVDTACKNPSRLTRSPFGTYDKPGDNQRKKTRFILS